MPYDQFVKTKLIILNKKKNGNLGYAFINLLTPQCVKEFYHVFNYRKWKLHNNNDKVKIKYIKYLSIAHFDMQKFRGAEI